MNGAPCRCASCSEITRGRNPRLQSCRRTQSAKSAVIHPVVLPRALAARRLSAQSACTRARLRTAAAAARSGWVACQRPRRRHAAPQLARSQSMRASLIPSQMVRPQVPARTACACATGRLPGCTVKYGSGRNTDGKRQTAATREASMCTSSRPLRHVHHKGARPTPHLGRRSGPGGCLHGQRWRWRWADRKTRHGGPFVFAFKAPRGTNAVSFAKQASTHCF